LENELLSNNDISLKCLYALCAIHSVSLIIIVGKKYYVYDFDSTTNASSDKSKIQNIIYRQPNGEFSIHRNATPEYTRSLLDSLYLVENVNKPIKSVSSYLVSDLKELCNKMNISIVDSGGKCKSKNKLYEDVLLFMNS
jgi:hypothetical protein